MMNRKSQSSHLLAWLIWIFGSSFLVYQFLLQTSISVMIAGLQQAFHSNAASIGFLSSSFFYTYFFLQVPGGLLVDRYGPRKVLTVGLFICVIAVALFAHAKSFWVAQLSRMLMGLVAAPAFAGAFYLIAHWFSPKRFALIGGLTESFAMLGGMLGEVFVSVRVAQSGWRMTLIECAIIGLLLAVLTGLIVRDRDKYHTVTYLPKANFSNILIHLKKVVGLPQVWLIGLFSGCTFALVSAFAGLWCVPYLQVRYNLPATTASFASSMIFIGVAVGSPFLGWYSDRIGKRKAPMFFSAALCLIFMLMVLYLPHLSFAWMFVLLFLVGATAAIYMLPFALIREITPKETRGTAMGFANMMAILIGSPILQPLIGKLLELDWDKKSINGVQIFHVTDYQISLSVLPICLLLALLVLIFICETNCQEISVAEKNTVNEKDLPLHT